MADQLTNEIRRIRQKISCIEHPAFSRTVTDVLNHEADSFVNPYTAEELVKGVKASYQKELEELLSKQSKFTQTKLEL